MSNPLHYRSIQGDVYAWALSSSYVEGMRVFDPSRALANDPDIYTKIELCSPAANALDQLCLRVASKSWRLTPASDDPVDVRTAKVLEALARKTPRFTASRAILARAALWGGRYAQMTGAYRFERLPDDRVPRRWWVPGRLVDIDRRRWRAIAGKTPDGGVTVRWEMWSVGRRAWEPIGHPEWFVKHIFSEREDALGAGYGLAESLQDDVYAYQIAKREGLEGLTRWAQGLPVLKLDGTKDAKTGLPNETLALRGLAVLKKMRAAGGLVIDKDDELELKEATGSGHQIVKDFLAILASDIRQRILGQDMQSGSEGGGLNKGLSEIADSTEAVIQAQQEGLDDTLSVDFVGLLHRLNKPALASMGLSEGRTPRFTTTKEKVEDPTKNVEVVTKALSAGIPLVRDEVYEKLGMTPPGPDDEVIEGHAPPDPFGGGAPFGADPAGQDPDAEPAGARRGPPPRAGTPPQTPERDPADA